MSGRNPARCRRCDEQIDETTRPEGPGRYLCDPCRAVRWQRRGELPRLPVKPLADYLDRYMVRNQLELGGLSDLIGITERTLFRWRTDGQMVQFDVLDRVMLRVGALWFDVYDDERWPFEHKVAQRVFDPPAKMRERKKAA